MRVVRYSIGIFVLLLVMAVSCKAPTVSKSESYDDGKIGITVRLPAAAGRAVFTSDDAASYKIEMSLNETVVQTKTGLPGQTVTLVVEAEGLYTVTVTAYDATEREIAKGSATADLKFGDGVVPLQIRIRGYKKQIEIVPEIIWEDEEDTEYDYLFEGPEITQTEHVKVEKVAGGLKFTVTRPDLDSYNPNVLLKEEFAKDEFGNQIYNYDYTDQGNGAYDWIEPEYVGEGKGSFVMIESTDEYGPYTYFRQVGDGEGDYEGGWTYVGKGNGSYTREPVINQIYGGWSYTAIRRIEKIDGKYYWTTSADLQWIDNKDGILECIYPLCEPGEKNVFVLYTEPRNPYEHFNDRISEYICVIPDEGIGVIDYSGIGRNTKVKLTYDGLKPIVNVENYNIQLPEYVKNVNTTCDIDAGNGDWDTEYATYWYTAYNGTYGIEYNISKDPYLENLKNSYWIDFDEDGNEIRRPFTEEDITLRYETYNFKTQIANCGKDEFCVSWFLTFELSDEINCDGVAGWRTVDIPSNVVKFR